MKKYTLLTLLFLLCASVCYPQYSLKEDMKKYFTLDQINEYNRHLEDLETQIKHSESKEPYSSFHYYLYSKLTEINNLKSDNPSLELVAARIYSLIAGYDREYPAIYNNLGCVLFRFAKFTNDFTDYNEQIKQLLFKSEKMGNQIAAYNLACYYSFINRKEESLKWLRLMASKSYNKPTTTIDREDFENESDFDNIKYEPEFGEFLEKYYSHASVSD